MMILGIAIPIGVFKIPFGAQQVAIENPAIQQQLRDYAVQLNEAKNKFENLQSEVNKNSDTNIEHSTKLLIMHNDIMQTNDILSPSDPDGISYSDIKTKTSAIIEEFADVKNYFNALQSAVDSIQSVVMEVKAKQDLSDSNLSRDIASLRETVRDANSALSDYVSRVQKELNDHKSNFDTTTSNVKDINKKMEKADDTVSEVSIIAKTATEMVDRANEKLKIMERHLFNKDALTAAILILFLLIIGLMLYVLKLKYSLELTLAGGSTSRPLKGSREMAVVLQKMPSNPTLDNAVCIVSFDASYSEEYKRMIKETVGQLGGVSFRTHVIRKHTDIAELPQCRLYIMCVEFTKRHVIIEEQGLGLGDLKLTSYRGVRKLGGALVILYIHDPGSRRLTDDQLYSDGVYCVKKQQELKELCEIDRFISAHNELNTAQKKALETAISNVLNIKAARH